MEITEITESRPQPRIKKPLMYLACCAFFALVALVLSAGYAAHSIATVVFNEVVSSNRFSLVGDTLGRPDWIELYNPSQQDIDLGGYVLTDKIDTDKYVFSDTIIPAGGHLLIYAGQYHVTQTGICVEFGVSKNGETLYLLDPDKRIVTELSVPPLPHDVSYARRDDGSYGYCLDTTPGSKNDCAGIMDADAFVSMSQAGTLTLTEVMPGAEGYAWAELFNPGENPVFLGNYCLTDDMSAPSKWRLPSRDLEAGAYAVVYLSGLDQDSPDMHASFEVQDSDALYLYDSTDDLISSITWPKQIPNGIAVLPGGRYTASPTEGYENLGDGFDLTAQTSMDAGDPIRLNEVLPVNTYSLQDSDGDRSAWAEIHNSGSQPVSLAGYYLSDDKADLLKWAFPDITIEPDGYMVVFLSGKSHESELHASFRISGETGVYLTSFDGMRVDEITLPQAPLDNVSVGRGSDGSPLFYAQPTPGTANAKGHADAHLLGHFDSTGVYISEVCAATKARSGKNDWIELHNGSSEIVDLEGYYLSDNSNAPQKWRIPALVIEPKGYAVIEASADPAQSSGFTANFGISSVGETLLLSNPQGHVIDVFKTGVLDAGKTSGRIEGDETLSRVFFDSPTRGQQNAAQYATGYASRPLFSEDGLYHEQEFLLSMSTATAQAKIYYTTDGSVPTQASKVYTQPITISANTPLRAVAYADGLLPSEVSTVTYLFVKPHTVPVVCISGQPKDMQFVLRTNRKRPKPEFDAHVEYYEQDGTLGVSFFSGVRPKGQHSLSYPQNSMIIRLRGAYGRKNVTYPFFEDGTVNTYATLSLRNSGQDTAATKIRDSFCAKVTKGINVDTVDTRTVVAYVNGVYCGVYDLNEEQNANHFAIHYGLDTSNIDIIDRNYTVMNGDNKEFIRVRSIARSWNMQDDEVFAEFAKLVDVDACTDYLITQIFFGNGDVFNQRFWRAQDYSVKWRPILFDLDWCLRSNNASRNVFHRYFSMSPRAGNGAVTHMEIFCALRKNKAWREKFVERFVELTVTQFDTDRMLSILDEMVADMKPEMPGHIAKWRTPRSMSGWENELRKFRSALKKRQDIVLRQLKQFFHVPDSTIRQYVAKYSAQSGQ